MGEQNIQILWGNRTSKYYGETEHPNIMGKHVFPGGNFSWNFNVLFDDMIKLNHIVAT
jgi:hypothetical protein